MASVINRPGGQKWIQFKWAELRRTLRLGKTTPQQARDIARHLEKIILAREYSVTIDPATAKWLTTLPAKLRNKLAGMGLVESVDVATLKQLGDYYVSKLNSPAESTLVNINVGIANAIAFFGATKLIVDITKGDAKEFKAWLRSSGNNKGGKLAIATASRRAGRVREMFEMATKKKWLTENPFEDIKRDNESNRERDHFVDAEAFAQILAKCVDQELRTILVLARYGGLRCPSEVLPMTWEQVDVDTKWIHVNDTKRKRPRPVPLFPEIDKELTALWAQAPKREPLLFPNHQVTNAALTGQLERLCKLARVWLWDKPWQNMRSTRETELLDLYPQHVVIAWIGHTKKVSNSHYAQVTREHHARAVDASLSNGGEKAKQKSEAHNQSETDRFAV